MDPDAPKTCRDCGKTYARKDFPVASYVKGVSYPGPRCRPCYNAHMRQVQSGRQEKNAAYRRKNAARDNARSAAWKAANPKRKKVQSFLSGCKQRDTIPTAEAIEYVEVLAGDPCSYCGATGPAVDHIVPVIDGGSSDWDNLTACCGSCNSRKWRKSLLFSLLDARDRNHTAICVDMEPNSVVDFSAVRLAGL